MRDRPNLAPLMLACLDGDAAAAGTLARGARLDGLADLAVEHGIAASVYERLGPIVEVDVRERSRLAAAALQNRINHGHIADDLRCVAGILEPLEAPWLVIKGPAVAATLYTPPELRNAGDIDLLVAPNRFARAIELLDIAGHPVDDANWPLVRRLTAGQLHFELPHGTTLDLHWHLLFNADDRARFPMTTEELVARRRTVRIAGLELSTLDPVDTLIHLCYHAAKEGGDRLAWLTDVSRAAAVPQVDWDAVVARTVAWRMELPVGTLLQRSARQLGAPVPTSVIDRLMPRTWRSLITLADRGFPVATTTRRRGNPASLLAKSAAVSSSPLGASAAAVSGLARRTLRLARTGTADRDRPAEHDNSPASLRYRAEFDAADREAYFAAVRAARGARVSD